MTQSAVSKIEAGRDEDITLKHLMKYSMATNERIGMLFGKPLTHVEAIKFHACELREHFSKLTELACNAEELEKEIQVFFSEAIFNILNILIETQNEMPKSRPDEMRLKIIAENPIAGINPIKREQEACSF